MENLIDKILACVNESEKSKVRELLEQLKNEEYDAGYTEGRMDAMNNAVFLGYMTHDEVMKIEGLDE